MTPEPVNQLAPQPAAPSIPTRRVFVFAGGAFVLGAALGGAGGYSTAVRRGDGDADGGATHSGMALPEPSGDADLDELRRLALVAPIEELAKDWLYFLDVFAMEYRNDRYLPQGVIRLADYDMDVYRGFSMPTQSALSDYMSQDREFSRSGFSRSTMPETYEA